MLPGCWCAGSAQYSGTLARRDATEYLVQLFFAHQERVVLDDELLVRLDEVQRDTIVESHPVEGAEPDRRAEPQQFGQEGRGRLRVTGMNDRVIQFD